MPTLLRAMALTVSVFLSATILSAQSSDFFRQQVLTVKRVIELNHYSPRTVNDSFSVYLFDNFIKRTDEEKLLTPLHMQELSKFRLRLDDELNGSDWRFIDEFKKMYRTVLEKADSTLTQSSSDKTKETIAKKRNIKSILNYPSGYDKYIVSIFCDVIANAFDPHTEYMPLQEKQQFDTELGTEGYYFGLTVDENESGNLTIDRLMPGSPAWKSGELNKGDELVNLTWEGKEPIDLAGANKYELSELLNSTNDLKIHLTIKKADGVEKTIALTKEKMKNESNIVLSTILPGEPRIGYIYLPDFYYGVRGASGSCAGDVATEILKLKKENIAGLIMDVRYNGGGSLTEALDMAGIFINEGPLSMIKEKTGKPISLKDMSRGTIYDGPMVVIVNSQSASASELLAAVLQDYNRAVVIGSPTFGKGTAQVVLPADTSFNAANNTSPEFGFIKVTTAKFYRVKGTTTQHAGVMPDIILPDLFEGLDYHESALPHALPSDTIAPNKYYQPLPVLPIAELSLKSKTRISGNPHFTDVQKAAGAPEDIYVKEASLIINDLINTQKNK